MSGCVICGRNLAKDNLCKYHQNARVNLRKGYDKWTQALDISFEDYLRELLGNEATGRWVKDTADAILAGDVVSTPS